VRLRLTILATDQFDVLTRFYRELTGWTATADVPVYLELRPSEDAPGIGVYARDAYARNLAGAPVSAGPAQPGGARPVELYLDVDDVAAATARATAAGGTVLGGTEPRPWGDVVQYVLDPDGNVVALASSPS
jgi:predicted enzyme related to lactoylglutathione lyase